MADRHDTSADHARHDALLIAALAAGDPEADERSRAETLVATCPACAELGRDLRAITAATTAAELPVPGRPRAFTLRPADAARLRPAGWRGLVRRFASPGWALTRPLAAGLTTLGLAGLLVAALPSLVPLSGGAAGAPASSPDEPAEIAASHAPAAPTAEPSRAAGALAPPVRSADPGVQAYASPAASIPPADTAGTAPARSSATQRPAPWPAASAAGSTETTPALDAAPGPSGLAVLSAILLVAGLGLFVLRRLAGAPAAG